MKPPHTSLHDCLEPLLKEIKELQNGYFLELGPSDLVFVLGALGVACLCATVNYI
jgi:hypothetical protein